MRLGQVCQHHGVKDHYRVTHGRIYAKLPLSRIWHIEELCFVTGWLTPGEAVRAHDRLTSAARVASPHRRSRAILP